MPLEGEYGPSPAQWIREQVELYERSAGTQANTLWDTGLPIIVVTMRGAKTSKIRKVPLMRVEHKGTYAAVATKGGHPHHPLWYYNLKADPLVDLQDGPTRQPMKARELTGTEKSDWWQRAVTTYPPYADYVKKANRVIPVFLLEPTSTKAPGDQSVPNNRQ